MDDLKCCPFCGGEAQFGEIEDPDRHDDGGHFIQCTNGMCAASSRLQFACGDDPRPLLAESWNRRTPPPLPTREDVARVICSHQMSHNSKGEALFPSFAADDPLVVDECDIYLSLADAVPRMLDGEKK